jgi:hypothetical protein
MSQILTIGSSHALDLERPLFGQFVRQVVPLRAEQLEKCLTLQRESGERLGEVMLKLGFLTRDQIVEVLRLQAQWVVKAMRTDMAPAKLPHPTFLSLCLPAYNERENIGELLDSAISMLPEFLEEYEVVVVDDGSTDGTAELVDEYSKKDPAIRVVRHATNVGYGGAVTSGLRAAKGRHIAFMDSDGQFSLLDLPHLLRHLNYNDIVIGYRHPRADSRIRRFNAWAWSQVVRAAVGVQVKDLDCAFKIFPREIVHQLTLSATGACINAEILAQCVQRDLTIFQIPVAHYPRCHGAPTGANLRVILRAFHELPQLWKYRRSSLNVSA